MVRSEHLLGDGRWLTALRSGLPVRLHYRVEVWTLCYHYFLRFELYVSMIVVLLVGPALISQDLRFNALQLYFSRSHIRTPRTIGAPGRRGLGAQADVT